MTTTTETRTVLVTGATRGIGLETARQLAQLGHHVWLGARDATRGDELAAELSCGVGGTVRIVQLDVTDDASVHAAADLIAAQGGLDTLVNNAGIGGRFASVEETVPADFLPVYGVNLLGPVRCILTFLPLLERADDPRIVNVSSGMGSFAVTTDPSSYAWTLHSLVYPSSKAALNMVTSQLSRALAGRVTVVAVDPGYTATDLNGHQGFLPVEVGAGPLVAAVTRPRDEPVVPFLGQQGPVGW